MIGKICKNKEVALYWTPQVNGNKEGRLPREMGIKRAGELQGKQDRGLGSGCWPVMPAFAYFQFHLPGAKMDTVAVYRAQTAFKPLLPMQGGAHPEQQLGLQD